MHRFAVTLSTGETVTVEGVDAYQPEGPLTTFFATGSSRQTIDSWSTRLASFRTADIMSIRRVAEAEPRPLHRMAPASVRAPRCANSPAAV
ncbi:MAG: hypothetical protein ACKV2O_06285 [Acidimicrobiales bacterium]